MRARSSSTHFHTFRAFAIVIALILASFYLLSSVLVPVLIAFTLYAIFEPLTNFLIRHNINQSISILMVLLLIVGMCFIAIGVALPQLVEQAGLLQSKLPQILTKLENLISIYGQELNDLTGADFEISELLVPLLSESSSFGQALLVGISNQLIGVIIGVLLIPFITYYLLKDYKTVRNSLLNWLPNSSFELGWLIYHRVSRQLQAYTRGVMIQSSITAFICVAGFSLIGLDIPVLLGFITGFLNLIPYVGPVISIMLALLVGAAMTPFDPAHLSLAILVILFAQVIDNVVVIPAVIANAVNLHPVQVILGIIIFGSLFGTLGVILAIPAIATGKIVFNNLYANFYNAQKKSPI
jgi:putative permease